MPELTQAKPVKWWRVGAMVAIAAVLFAMSCMLDQAIYRHVKAQHPYTTFPSYRGAGTIHVWLLVALGLLLVDMGRFAGQPVRNVTRRGALLSLSVILGGLLANVLKVLIRRERPDLNAAHYVFRAWSDRPLSGVDLGLPSGHTTVAFAAAYMLTRLHPRGAPAWFLIAFFCAANRVASGAHFLSDACAAVFVGFAAGEIIWRWHLLNERRRLAAANASTNE